MAARVKVKPDFDKIEMGINPFTENLTIYVTKKINKTINKFGNLDDLEFELEKTPYTKVFEVEGARKQVCELPIRSKELYLHFIHAIRSAKDYLWIDRGGYMKQMGILSINTYKQAVRGLFEAGYIQPHGALKDVYWINPHFFFKGSRINKYKNSVRIPKADKK